MGQESGRRPKFDLGEQRETPQARVPSEPQDEHRAFNVIVGEAIRRARQEHGWTQASLAEQAGLSPNYVARLERGELGPSLFVANRLCEALGVTLETLVSTSGTTQPRTRTTTRNKRLAG